MSVARLETGFTLDRLYRWLEGLVEGNPELLSHLEPGERTTLEKLRP
jgi:hypothetical protein